MSAEHDGKLYIPIQINGGGIPGDSLKLKERELYVCFDSDKNTLDGMLYVGKPIAGSTDIEIMQISAGHAGDATRVGKQSSGSEYIPFYLSTAEDEKTNLQLAGFKISPEEPLLDGQDANAENGCATITNFNALNLKSLHVTDDMYGTELPSTGTVGQIFFKI